MPRDVRPRTEPRAASAQSLKKHEKTEAQWERDAGSGRLEMLEGNRAMTSESTISPPASTVALARRAGLASLVGTTIEWYDYFIFGTASALVFGRLFFPGEDPITGTLASFAVFGVGFVARPLGGMVFGHLGDKFGRKGVLVTTLMITGLSTMLIGFLPTYTAIGIWAPILLVLLRLIQGFGVGGEWGGASLVAVEYAPPGKRGLYGSLPQVGNGIGVVLATGVFTVVSLLPDDALFSWGWRVPFIASALLVVVGAFIRLQLAETPAFLAAKEAAESSRAEQTAMERPLKTLVRDYRKPLFLAMGVKLAEGAYGYIVLTFLVAYATTYTELPRGSVLLATTLAGAGSVVTFFLVGALSDRVGRRQLVMIGAFVGVVMAFPFFWLLNMNSVPLMFLGVLVTYLCGNGVIYAVQSSFFSEMFDTSVRYSGISLAYQLPSILVGAIPFAATAMVAATDGAAYPVSLMLICTSLLGFFCAYFTKDARDRQLDVDQFS
ncbi:MFS transporter [Mycolicibacterium litorale]|uniref:MFS transporter n=1 Tax=Mycolicibacterium litorale TaxID=758802 RepID=UPI003CFB1CA9